MKRIKIILAWLDWSTYCYSWRYERPKTLCPLFWRSFFAVLTIPLIWPTHVISAFQPKDDWRKERESGFKMDIWRGLLFHALVLFIGGMILKEIDRIFLTDWISHIDPFWISYPKMIIMGIIGAVAVILALATIGVTCYGLWHGGKWLYNKLKPVPSGYVDDTPKEPSWIKQAYLAIKDKYCPIIDWSEIETN